MNPDFKPSPEDRLIEELLHEQHHGADEEFFRKIEAAVDGAPAVSNKSAASRSWGRYGIAASIALAVSGAVWWQNDQRKQERLAVLQSAQPDPAVSQRLAAEEQMRNLTKSIQEQEDKLEERRKVLSTIVRTKGIIYKSTDSFYNEGGVDSDQAAKDAAMANYRQLEVERIQLADELSKLNQAGVEKAQDSPTGKADEQRESLNARMDLVSDRLEQTKSALEESTSESVIARGLDAQDYVDAKRDFEADQQQLLDLKMKQVELAANSGIEIPKAVRPPSVSASSPAAQAHKLESLPRVRGVIVDSRESSTSDRYGKFIDQPWKTPNSDPLSTFSIDVDTASYGNVRRMIQEGRTIPRDAVRIEECINAFSYSYQAPKGDAPFAVGASLAVCPWNPEHQLVRVAIKGREVDAAKRPASNLVFLIDVSGSMQSPDKLPLLKRSMATLVEQLDERDRVAIVVYAGSEGVALPSTRLDAEGRSKVLQTLNNLSAGGSTNGGAGIKRAYQIAMDGKLDGGVNRVILATDGDFNVGVTGNEELVSMVKERAKSGVYLTVLGYGTGNLNDSMMDSITRDGNGNYFYIDSEREGRKVFLRNLSGTLVTIAKDVKIQVEFNPAKVGGYRLIGYANRVLKNEDFNNDKVDAGDIGAGHTVTAFYEVTPKPVAGGTDALKYRQPTRPAESNDEWLTVKLRHKHPDGDESRKIEFSLTGIAPAIAGTDADFQFACAVAAFGMKLRGMEEVGDFGWNAVKELARPGLARDQDEDRAEFMKLLDCLSGVTERAVPQPAEVIRPR